MVSWVPQNGFVDADFTGKGMTFNKPRPFQGGAGEGRLSRAMAKACGSEAGLSRSTIPAE
jgi:hypothetical protein